MANEILTHQKVAREAAKMLVEQANLIKRVNTGRSDEFGKDIQGYKIGDSVDIGIPPVPTVYSGSNFAAGGSAPDTKEKKVRLTLDTQKHVPLTFTAKEKLLNITDFKERFLRPAMQSLISDVQADLLARWVAKTPNVVGTWGTTPTSRKVYGGARAVLEKGLAPTGDRTVLFSSDANLELAEANATLFHSRKEIEAEFDDGAVGMYAGFEFFENQSIPVHTNGAGTGYAINGAGQTGSSLAVDTGAGAITKGSIIVIDGVNAVHPITGKPNGRPRSFIVTADYAGGAGNLQISPAISVTTAAQVGTVTALPADGAAVTVFGDASDSARQNLAFERNALAAAFAPLPVLASCEGYTASIQGVSVRVMTFGDGKADQEHTRVDVLYGEALVREDHVCRITE